MKDVQKVLRKRHYKVYEDKIKKWIEQHEYVEPYKHSYIWIFKKKDIVKKFADEDKKVNSC